MAALPVLLTVRSMWSARLRRTDDGRDPRSTDRWARSSPLRLVSRQKSRKGEPITDQGGVQARCEESAHGRPFHQSEPTEPPQRLPDRRRRQPETSRLLDDHDRRARRESALLRASAQAFEGLGEGIVLAVQHRLRGKTRTMEPGDTSPMGCAGLRSRYAENRPKTGQKPPQKMPVCGLLSCFLWLPYT